MATEINAVDLLRLQTRVKQDREVFKDVVSVGEVFIDAMKMCGVSPDTIKQVVGYTGRVIQGKK